MGGANVVALYRPRMRTIARARYNLNMGSKESFDREIGIGEQARAGGNEGRARVCARRAAGIAAAEYYARRGQSARTTSALDLLSALQADAAVPAEARPLIINLLLQVNEGFELPSGVDLLADARRLRAALLGVD